jgi:hypothetical protein
VREFDPATLSIARLLGGVDEHVAVASGTSTLLLPELVDALM